ncbi:cell division control protein 6 [Monosporozyma servazzii]
MNSEQLKFITPVKQIASSEGSSMMTPPASLDNVKKRLFDDNSEDLKTPCKKQQTIPISPQPSPQKLVFGKNSIYSRTKVLLQRSSRLFTADTGCLPTRGEQYDEIIDFLDDNMSQGKSSSLYITGPPGTGKTAQLNAIIRNKFLPLVPCENNNYNNKFQLEIIPNLKNQSYYQLRSGEIKSVVATNINCIALSDPSYVFNVIHESFNSTLDNTTKKVRNMEQLQTYMESFQKKITFVVVLDEMDKLLYSSQNDTIATKILFELFLLARLPSINFLLIGIANSLDLKDRFLSRLNLRQELLPTTVVFHPYSAEQMYDIVMNRIKTVNDVDGCIFNPIAIKFATKKCSGSTGDLRKLFDVLRNSIEIVELEVVKQLKKNGINNLKIIKVGMPHVAKVFSQINNNVSTRSRIGKLNMQQRIILCALVNRENIDIFHSSCSLDDAYDYYKEFLERKDSVMKPLKRNEFLEISNNLETCGVVTINHGRSHGKTKHVVKLIKTSLDKKEFEEEISKLDILKRFV